MVARYIVWQEQQPYSRRSVSDLIRDVPEIEILREKNPDSAVVLMAPETEEKIRTDFPHLSVERDVQHRVALGSL
jgi:hypothetical protein